jgi:hypothetical protein
MRTKTEVITPEWAIDILENHNPYNRKLSENTVQAYAADMRNGRWVLNHQGLAFDTNKNLCDGQHRLWAVVFSGKTIESLVTYDIPVSENKNGIELNSMDTIDRGRFRQTGQQMQLHGIKNGALTAAACRSIALMVYPSGGTRRLSTTKDIESVIDCLDHGKRKGYIVGPLTLYHHGEQEKAREFCRQISTLDGLTTPTKTFVKYLEQNIGLNPDKTSRILAQCILAFHEGRQLLKVMDTTNGREFLVGMYPSYAKRVREAMKPCDTRAIKLALKKNRKAKEKKCNPNSSQPE